MADQTFHEMFPLGDDMTEYRKLTSDYVSTADFEGDEVLVVDPAGIKQLSAQAFVDIAHYLRPGHLQQLRNILDDPEASDNDRFVALDFMKNANIAAGGILPMCQDTGTAIIMAKKGKSGRMSMRTNVRRASAHDNPNSTPTTQGSSRHT